MLSSHTKAPPPDCASRREVFTARGSLLCSHQQFHTSTMTQICALKTNLLQCVVRTFGLESRRIPNLFQITHTTGHDKLKAPNVLLLALVGSWTVAILLTLSVSYIICFRNWILFSFSGKTMVNTCSAEPNRPRFVSEISSVCRTHLNIFCHVFPLKLKLNSMA
jgi:hypothetical protein